MTLSHGDELLAIDVGGTRIKVGRVGRDGHPTYSRVFPTPGPGEQPDTLASLCRILGDEVSARPAAAVGVVVPGWIDEEQGVVCRAVNLGWYDLPLRDILAREVSTPMALGHDVRAGGLAEARLGAARDVASSVFIAVGTGIGSAIMDHQRSWAGATHNAGEVGHLVVVPGGDRCACGQLGCLETVASAAAISRRYARAARSPAVDAAVVIERAGQCDEHAKRVWREAVDALAEAIVTVHTLLDPAVFVIGGGLSRAGDALLEPLRDACRRSARSRTPEIRAGDFADSAGWRGAALMAADLVEWSFP